MLAPEQVALVLLAAGRSRRFEGGDKLAEPFLHQPLAYHVTTALSKLTFAARIAVVAETSLDFARLGYRVVTNTAPAAGLSHSLRLGIGAAIGTGAEAVVIALADMPRVTAAQICRLIDEADGPDALVASSDGTRPGPPALFGSGWFDRLQSLDGDQGARALLKGGRHIVTSPAELIDIDTRDDLRQLRAEYGVPGDGLGE